MNSSAATPTPGPHRRSKWLNRYTVGVGAMAVLAVGGYAGWKHFRGKKSELDQYQITTVQRTDIEDLVTATGSLQPREYVDVGAQVSGQLKKIHVEIGSVVRAGDLLAEIDPTVYRANVDALLNTGPQAHQARLTAAVDLIKSLGGWQFSKDARP